jgi:NADH-quinone oxidoreductase subunit J
MVQIFVYGGGIMVLFLFVIMLINLHRLAEVKIFGGLSPLAAVVGVLLLAFFGFFFLNAQFATPVANPAAFVTVAGENLGNSQAVAWSLYTENLLPFEIASLFLLVAMIGAVVLGRRQ